MKSYLMWVFGLTALMTGALLWASPGSQWTIKVEERPMVPTTRTAQWKDQISRIELTCEDGELRWVFELPEQPRGKLNAYTSKLLVQVDNGPIEEYGIAVISNMAPRGFYIRPMNAQGNEIARLFERSVEHVNLGLKEGEQIPYSVKIGTGSSADKAVLSEMSDNCKV